MNHVGFVGWRGMVGSVLMQRMVEEKDFDLIEPVYFSTSSAGGKAPVYAGKESPNLKDASDIESLSKLDIILSLSLIHI
jgi:aspartate-semialdehyde dehydrogenase